MKNELSFLYELTNHLGNVLTVVSDRKIAVETTPGSGIVDHFIADIVSSTDYYAFGSPMNGRQFNSNASVNGFNGMRKDDEIAGSGNDYDFGARIYDSRLGRFLTTDPAKSGFPFESPYVFAGNTPIQAIDVNGERIFFVNKDGTVLDLSIEGNIDLVDDNNFKIAYKTLLDTYTGAELLSIMNTKYDNHDVFIGRDKRHRYHNNAGAHTNRIDKGDFKIGLPILAFTLGGKNVAWDKYKGKYSSYSNDQYELAESLYHEIWAHVYYAIENPKADGEAHHTAYGSYYVGLDLNRKTTQYENLKLPFSPETNSSSKVTPYKIIATELLQLKAIGGSGASIISTPNTTSETKGKSNKPQDKKPKQVPMF